jgi:hypothetical protein
LFKGCVTGQQQQPSTSSGSETGVSAGVSSELNEHERGPLSYIAGYVLSNLKKKSVQKKNDELQTILQTMICPDVENSYVASRSRGGLVTPSQDIVRVLEVVENLFREFIQKQTSVVWENIMQDCSQETSKQTKKLCLENIVKLYLRFEASHMRKTISAILRCSKKQ